GEPGHVDLVVEVPDVGHDRLVLHPAHVVGRDDVEVAGGGDEDVGGVDDVLQGGDLEAVHRGLQRADRVDLGDDDAGALAAQRLGAALADVAVVADDGDLAADDDVGGAVQAFDDGVAAAVLVVELRLGDGVVDVDRREGERAGPGHLVEAVDAGGGLLGDALDAGGGLGPAAGLLGDAAAEGVEDDAPLLRVVLGGGGDGARLLVLGALVDEEGRVAAVVQDHVGAGAVGPLEGLVGAPPVLFEGLALPGEHRDALRVVDGAVGADDDRGGG